MLHTINKSPFEKNTLETCLRLAVDGASILYIEDGVYSAVKNTKFEQLISDKIKNIKMYVLEPDLKARGLDKSSLINNIEVIDYQGFVKLAVENEKIQNWLKYEVIVMTIEVNGKSLETDEEGYLSNLSDWEKDVADVMAKADGIDLSDDHWEIINFLREYYEEYQIAPAVRVLTKAVGKKLGKDKGNSKYLYELFPYGPGKQACKFAGLPKPTGCV